MFDYVMLYDILYALAARDGRDQVLFGPYAPRAHEAFSHSVAGADFPEVWFELPLAGDPWFDLHVATNRDSLVSAPSQQHRPAFSSDRCDRGIHSQLFDWFARQPDARQLVLSHDVSKGVVDCPAVHLLLNRHNLQLTCDFLAQADRADAEPAYRAFVEQLPSDWFACYAGVFPSRPDLNVRVECIPGATKQRAYAQDRAVLATDLQQVGLDSASDTLLDRCQALARMPVPIEFQCDVTPDGKAGQTFGASLRFNCPPGTSGWASFDAEGPAGDLMRLVESWGLADDRWPLIQKTAHATHVKLGGDMLTLYCYPAFLKLRWRSGQPLDAKVYLVAGAE